MSRLSRLAVSKRSVTLLFAAALFVAGISAWGSLKQELLPDIEFPVVTVVTPYPGAGSSDVLEQVTRPIERAIGAIPRLELIQSTSSNSISLVVTQFAFGSNVPETTAAIQDALAKAALPDSATPTVQALNINASPVVVSSIAATSPDGLEQVATIARTEIVPEVAAIEGVARADLTGGLETRLAVTLDPAKLTSSGVSTQQVVAVLGANNLTLPSGQLPADGSRTPVSTIGRLTSAEEVEALVVGYAGTPPAATPVTIGDLGTVELDSIADDRLRADQRPAGADPDGVQDLEREHRRGRRRRPGQAVRDRRPPRGRDDRQHRPGPVGLHQGIARRPAPRGRPGRHLRGHRRSSCSCSACGRRSSPRSASRSRS